MNGLDLMKGRRLGPKSIKYYEKLEYNNALTMHLKSFESE